MGLQPDEFTGQIIGEYEILSRLAVGGSAEIFLGFSDFGPMAFTPVVIKKLLSDSADLPVDKDALINEAQLIARLKHQHIAQLANFSNTPDATLMAIEFVDGPTVEEMLDRASSEPIPIAMCVAVAHAAALGLGHAHAHRSDAGNNMPIVHRDLNPKNLMVAFDGGIKVLDFGIAKLKGSKQQTRAGMVRGTTAYMSPEQTMGQVLDPRSDVFSLGIVFHEMLTGRRLFFRDSPLAEMQAILESPIPLPSSVNQRVSKQLDRLVMKALDRDIEKRFRNGDEFAAEIEKAVPAMVWSTKDVSKYVCLAYSEKRIQVFEAISKIKDVSRRAKTVFGAPRLNTKDSPAELSGEFGRTTDPDFPRPELRTTVMARPSSMKPKARVEIDSGSPATKKAREKSATKVSNSTSQSTKRWLIYGFLALLGGIGAGFLAINSFKKESVLPSARLVISSKIQSQVILGDQVLGSTPLEIMMTPGQHELKMISEAGIKYVKVELFERTEKKIEVTW